MNMTTILLAVSVGCNLWFLFLLLYDRIMETRFVRFLKSPPPSYIGNKTRRTRTLPLSTYYQNIPYFCYGKHKGQNNE